MREIKRYLKIWLRLSYNSFSAMFFTRFSAVIFLLGKILRFSFILIFLLAVFSKVPGAGGYSKEQIIIVFLIYSLIDTLSQFLFREVYRFRPKVVFGTFDKDLVKPVSPLFLSLFGGADVLDLITVVIYTLVFFIFLSSLVITPLNFSLFLLFLINGVVLAAAFHIIVLSIGILTTEVDHLIMIYRDVENLGRIPVDFYDKALRFVLTYLLPIGIMMTVPAKILFGLWNVKILGVALVVSLAFFYASLRFWGYALQKYSSASS